MQTPILNHLTLQGILIVINFTPPFYTFPCVPLVLGIATNILASHHLLTKSLLVLFPWY